VSTPAKSRIDYEASGRALQASNGDDSPSNAIVRHKKFLDARATNMAKWVTQGVRPEALIRFALMDMDGPRGDRLRECTSQSIYLGLLACAVTGLEPGALRGEAYLVPYKNKGVMEATFMPGWRGLVKQARRSRDVTAIGANVVFERDTFELDLGTANTIVHRPALRERGDIIGAYAIARLVGGGTEIEWMDRDDLNAVRRAGSNGPAWTDWEDQMYRKAPIRRLCKRLPLGSDYYVALALEHAQDSSEQARILDVATDGDGGRSREQSAAASEMEAQVLSQEEQREIAEQERKVAQSK